MRVVHTAAGTAGRVAAMHVATGAAVGAAWAADPPRADRTGEQVVESLCISCHCAGVEGAPRIGDGKAWAEREAKGLTGLAKSATSGIRQMPPHGGNMNLADIAVERAITCMFNASATAAK